MAGFIKLYRGWRNDPDFRDDGPISEREAWLWLIENAAWKDMTRRTGQGGVVSLERGQLHISLAGLATAWKWSIKRVRGFLERLGKSGKLGTVTDKRGTVLTITNYRKYQDNGHSEGTDGGTARAQLGHTQEEGKEGKEENNYAFAGRVVRLNGRDFDRWQANFPLLDLKAVLQSRDDFLINRPEAERVKWFQSTSAWLARKQQEAFTARQNGAVMERPVC
jgi:hypothetical protein